MTLQELCNAMDVRDVIALDVYDGERDERTYFTYAEPLDCLEWDEYENYNVESIEHHNNGIIITIAED